MQAIGSLAPWQAQGHRLQLFSKVVFFFFFLITHEEFVRLGEAAVPPPPVSSPSHDILVQRDHFLAALAV